MMSVSYVLVALFMAFQLVKIYQYHLLLLVFGQGVQEIHMERKIHGRTRGAVCGDRSDEKMKMSKLRWAY